MKNILFLLVFSFHLPSTIYSIKLKNYDGGNIDFAEFKGKKIIIVEYDEERPNINQLKHLDSLQKVASALNVIAIPISTEKNKKVYYDLKKIRSQLKLSLQFSKPLSIVKENNKYQDDILNWLSTDGQFNHIRNITHRDGQMFFINSEGVLFGSLAKNAPKTLIQELSKK